MDYLQEIHRLIVQNEREIRALKARIAAIAVGSTLLAGALPPHGFLSAAHIDTVPGGADEGALVIGGPDGLWIKLPLEVPGTGRNVLAVENGMTTAEWMLDTGGSGSSSFPIWFYTDATILTDGVEVSFPTLDFFEEGSVEVFLNGLALRPLFHFNEDITLGSVTLTSAPGAGDQLLIRYQVAEA